LPPEKISRPYVRIFSELSTMRPSRPFGCRRLPVRPVRPGGRRSARG
jgi:hypothetical protein